MTTLSKFCKSFHIFKGFEHRLQTRSKYSSGELVGQKYIELVWQIVAFLLSGGRNFVVGNSVEESFVVLANQDISS